jgi:hypothetical protein
MQFFNLFRPRWANLSGKSTSYAVPVSNSPYKNGLYSYLVERAVVALTNKSIELDEIDPNWIDVEATWSITWSTSFKDLNWSLKEKLAFDVKDSAILCILTSKEISYEEIPSSIKRFLNLKEKA